MHMAREVDVAGSGWFRCVSVCGAAVQRALEAANGKDVHVMGGADVVRQALAAGIVDELTVIIAPGVLGAGKRLFDGFSDPPALGQLGGRRSPHAPFIYYRVKPSCTAAPWSCTGT